MSVGERAPTDFDWTVRYEIYRVFGERGEAASPAQLADTMHASEQDVLDSIARLYGAHEIAPMPDGSVWMANPFSAVPTDFRVETASMTCWANCAWDALGVPAILGIDGWTHTRCAESGDPLEFGVRDGALDGDEGVIHLVTPVRNAWDDIGFT